MAKQDEYIRITTRIPPELRDALVELAKRAERSLNGELVARLQIAVEMARDETRPYEVRDSALAKYDVADVTNQLLEVVKRLPKDKQRALLALLK
ncbi:MAG TPA: Arc family DNA-binding protein [Sideroxyarcus sp.]|nr:Arc family DNA-binding protein [Sideroxyarcus sp.]